MAASHSCPLKSSSKVKSKSRCEGKRRRGERVFRGGQRHAPWLPNTGATADLTRTFPLYLTREQKAALDEHRPHRGAQADGQGQQYRLPLFGSHSSTTIDPAQPDIFSKAVFTVFICLRLRSQLDVASASRGCWVDSRCCSHWASWPCFH